MEGSVDHGGGYHRMVVKESVNITFFSYPLKVGISIVTLSLKVNKPKNLTVKTEVELHRDVPHNKKTVLLKFHMKQSRMPSFYSSCFSSFHIFFPFLTLSSSSFMLLESPFCFLFLNLFSLRQWLSTTFNPTFFFFFL